MAKRFDTGKYKVIKMAVVPCFPLLDRQQKHTFYAVFTGTVKSRIQCRYSEGHVLLAIKQQTANTLLKYCKSSINIR